MVCIPLTVICNMEQVLDKEHVGQHTVSLFAVLKEVKRERAYKINTKNSDMVLFCFAFALSYHSMTANTDQYALHST